MIAKISLAIEALADRLFVASHSVTQEAISKADANEQRAIAESFRLSKPIYFYSFDKKKEKEANDSEEYQDSDYY